MIAVSDFVREVKKASSIWSARVAAGFQWQEGYGAFSVSPSGRDEVARYIRWQEEHHRRLSFRDEFITILSRPFPSSPVQRKRRRLAGVGGVS